MSLGDLAVGSLENTAMQGLLQDPFAPHAGESDLIRRGLREQNENVHRERRERSDPHKVGRWLCERNENLHRAQTRRIQLKHKKAECWKALDVSVTWRFAISRVDVAQHCTCHENVIPRHTQRCPCHAE